jgi:ABC-type Zn uptake system ZnuABC Zn-binding protein ZnuA
MLTLRCFLFFLVAPLLPATAAEKIRVSSFSSVLTEIAERVGGERVVVTAHVKAGTDPHDFEPRPSDLKTVSQAQLVLLSAKHLEGYVGKLREATGGKANIIEVGNQFDSLKDEDHEDPHWWHSVRNIARATKVVRDELIKVSPDDRAFFNDSARAYLNGLDDLEKWVKNKVAELPRDRRKLVTNHDAFAYFARDFGFTVYPINGVSKNTARGSKAVAAIVDVIRTQGVKAIFTEDIENPKVLREITHETGAQLGGKLYSDGLGTTEAKTIAEMFKYNVGTIVDALK